MSRALRAALAVALAFAPLLRSAPATAQERPSARLGLASQTPWVRGDGAFTIRLDVDRVRRPQDLDLEVVVHRAVTSRSQFARTIDGELLGQRIHSDVVPFEDLRFDPGGAVPVSIDLPSLRPGVYPVSVDLVDHRTGASVASLVTHLIRVPDEPAEVPLDVAWVQPYGVDPALHPDGTTELSDAQLDELRTMASTLDDGVPMTVTPTPETVDALGTLDDGQTQRALATLLGSHQVVATPFVDVDASALVAASRVDDLRRQRTEGDRVLRQALGLSADNRTWSAEGHLSPAAVRALSTLGITRVVVDEDALEPLPASATRGLTLTRPFVLGGESDTQLDAVAVDAGLAAHFEEPDDVLGAHHLLADLAVLQLDSPGVARGVVIRPPADVQPTDAFLSTVLADIASSPLLRPVTLNGLFRDVDPLQKDDKPVVRQPAAAAPASLGVSGSSIDAARAQMSGFGSIAGTANPDLALLDRELLVAESTDLRPLERQGYVDAVRERVSGASSKVRVLGDRTYRLTAREGKIPLTLVNDNPFDILVSVELTSDKLTFTESPIEGRQSIRDIAVRANGTTTQAIPVKARTSGAFPMRVTVRSPDGQLELGRATYTITSTVASGVGIFLSVGALVFLLLWWAKHWRTVRRARRLVTTDE